MLSEEERARLRQEIETRSGYYSVDLGDHVIERDREDRYRIIDEALALVDFTAKDVLELGATFGTFHSRLTRTGMKRCCCVDQQQEEVELIRLVDRYLDDDRFSAEALDIERGMLRREVRDLFGRDTFDVVIFMGVLYHLSGPLRLLLQMPLLLREGGELLLETDVMPGQNDTNLGELGYLDGEFAPKQRMWRLSAKLVRDALVHLGFEILHEQGYLWGTYEKVELSEANRVLLHCRKVKEPWGFRATEDGDWIEQDMDTTV